MKKALLARKNGVEKLYNNCHILLDYIKAGKTDDSIAWNQSCADDVLCVCTQVHHIV